jgi:SAM-dependent methyltransferase
MTDIHDQHQHQGHGHEHAHGAGADGMTDLLVLDADILHDYWAAALDWVRSAYLDGSGGLPPERVLDLGAGTGTGAIGLAQRFPAAQVFAADVSTDSLGRLRDKLDGLGLAERLRPVQADLDAGWPDLGTLDLTWASMSLHHLADPASALRHVLSVTSPGGLIAVAEFARPLRFLPDDLGFGEAGFEERVQQRLSHARQEEMPTLGSQWAPRLADAGWDVIGERDFPIDLDPPTHPRAGEYARGWFTRLSHGLDDRLEPADREVLAALLEEQGPHFVAHRGNLRIHGVRTVTLARGR